MIKGVNELFKYHFGDPFTQEGGAGNKESFSTR